MATVLEILQQFLCYGNSSCISEFQSYAYQPIEGIFYLVFFPIVFILVFIYIISSAVGTFRETKKFRILIAVAVFAFIILQGWYHFFLILGQLWLLVLVILGVFWIILHTFVGGASGGGARSRVAGVEGGGGAMGSLLKRIRSDVTGETKRLENELNMALEEMKIVENAVKSGDSQAFRMIASSLDRMHALRREYIALLKGPGGFRIGGKFRQFEAKIDKAIKRLQHLQSQVKPAAA
ncbi:MAG: hypothetical protein JSV63_04120 [Candidatus Aenigmatarchaeota archaeon]|nr:MAG: hypothetical protein JSV63_04120 [Candidatus Aenigmarchaeota archaeon]